ncbi:RNA polymerase sigma factor [Phenylobacterium sp.]|uniref:RNA polymerase sigma factor n=1 Tax=Phenylobacterium sp. TaxID=1871053 RepID=UPI002FC7C189
MNLSARRVTEKRGAGDPAVRLVSGADRPADLLAIVELRLRNGRTGHLRYLRSRLRSPEDAEDVLQEFALKAVQGAPRLASADRVDAWLAVTLRNALFDRYRRNAGRRRLQDAVAVEPADGGETEDIEPALNCLSRVIDSLSPEAAVLLRRCELQDVPVKRVAEELGITANNAGVRAHRARAALRQAMGARCAACPARCAFAERFLTRAAA